MTMYNVTLAEKYYQLGLSREEAVRLGAYGAEFDMLVGRYKNESIPVPDLYHYKSKRRTK